MAPLSKLWSRDFAEVIIGYSLILLVIWTPNPPQQIIFWIAFAWIAGVTMFSRSSLRNLGLTFSLSAAHIWRSVAIVATAVSLACIAVVVSANLHTLHIVHGHGPGHMWGYIIWSFMQQFILQIYFFSRLLRILPRENMAILVAAGLFATAHLPNPLLTVLTFVWGVAACALFLRQREVYTLGFVHAILGICIAFTVPNAIHHHMRVGLGYIRYHHDYPVQQAAPRVHDVPIEKS